MPEDSMDKAAAAFDAVIATDPGTVTKPGKPVGDGPVKPLFPNVGELDPDTDAKGGGDEDVDPEEAIYADSKDSKRNKADTGDSDEEDESAEDSGDDAARDGDGEDGEGGEEEKAAGTEVLEQKVEVTVDGEPVEVSVKEALEGYVRTETFHRRMNQLDEAKKIVRRAAADAVQNYEYSMNVAKQMEEHMKQIIPPEPNWDEEFKKDPGHARELQRYYEKANAFRTQLNNQLGEAAKKMSESQNTQLQAFAEEEHQKFEQMNSKYWSDPNKKTKDLTSMRRTALSAGFSEEEVSQVYDSRMLQVLLKASKYDRMMAAKPKPVVRPQGKPIPPGAGSAKARTAQKGVTSAMKRLNRTGRMEDAAVVFDQLIARK
jgi:hypothetical protein